MADSQELTTQEQHPLMRVDTATGEVAVVDAQPYRGIAVARFSPEQAAILNAGIPDEDIDILPTGELYVSQIRYRRILNEAFGPGGWALMPRTPLVIRDNILFREYALFAEGRFVAEAVGEADYIPNNPRMTYATAAEAVKSNALVRCCKDLLIASECWDRHFCDEFKRKYCENKGGRYSWRRKGAPEAEDSGGGQGGRKASGRGVQPSGAREAHTDGVVAATAPPARPGPDDVCTEQARDTFWRTLNARMTEAEAKKWMNAQYKALGMKTVADIERMTVGQLAVLYQKLAEVPEKEHDQPTLTDDADAAIGNEERDIEY